MEIGFFKGQPTEYIIKYASGRITREGMGLAFFYLKHNTSVVSIPTSSTDASFVFNEVTNNFQAVTIQGQLTYRIASPGQAVTLLNFTIDPVRRAYLSKDPELLPQRITNVIQMQTRSEIQQRSLEETLRDSQSIAGVALEIGIEPTIRHALDLGYLPILVDDACGWRDEPAARRTRAQLEFIGGTIMSTSRDVADRFLDGLLRIGGRRGRLRLGQLRRFG